MADMYSEYCLQLSMRGLLPGQIDIIGAGRRDDSYVRRIENIDWERFYGELEFREFLATTRRNLLSDYDFLVCDVPAGIQNPASTVLLDFADAVVGCFEPARRSLEYLTTVIRHIQSVHRDIRFFPVPSRVGPRTSFRVSGETREICNELGRLVEMDIDDGYWAEVEMWSDWRLEGKEILPAVVALPWRKNDLLSSCENLLARILGDSVSPTRVSEDVRRNLASDLGVKEFEYDVALSFAGEDRAVAEELAERLRLERVSVFYDRYEEGVMWGKDLYGHLSDIYQNRAQFCLMIISRHYAEKQWTSLERRAAQARAFKNYSEYILPLRLDDTEIEGVLPTVAYVDYRKSSAEKIVHLVLEKLARNN
jgi:hypothetical protein